jgi:hypothetical protein
MSLSSKNLSSIQKAGQAVHDASAAISTTVRTQAESMVACMSAAPFSAESEQSISRFKTLAKLSQGLGAVEAQLQELYALATDLASPASDVIMLPSTHKRQAVTNAAAVDVTVKPAKPARKAKSAKKGADKGVVFTANDSKLLDFLQGALKGGAASKLTGNAISAGSGLPLGSVGISLKKVVAAGAIKQLSRGTYQLVATSTATAPVAVSTEKNAPTKKIKPAVAKKVKAVNVDVPATPEVKAKSAKGAKPAPVKKAKVAPAKKGKAAAKTAAPIVVSKEPAAEAEAAPV